MPKVKLAGDRYKDKDLSELIRRYKYGKDMTNADMAKAVGVCQTTWKNWLSAPEKIPLGKLRTIRVQLGIPKEEMTAFLL